MQNQKTKLKNLSLFVSVCAGFLVFSASAQAERFFQSKSTWYEPIANSSGDDPYSEQKMTENRNISIDPRYKDGITTFGGKNNPGAGWGEWSPTIWQASGGEITVDFKNLYCARCDYTKARYGVGKEWCSACSACKSYTGYCGKTTERSWIIRQDNLSVPIPANAKPAQWLQRLAAWPKDEVDGKMAIISSDKKTSWNFGSAAYFPTYEETKDPKAPVAVKDWYEEGHNGYWLPEEYRGKFAAYYLLKWDNTGDGVMTAENFKSGGPTDAGVPLIHGTIMHSEIVGPEEIDHALAMTTHMWCNGNIDNGARYGRRDDKIYPAIGPWYGRKCTYDRISWVDCATHPNAAPQLSDNPVGCQKGGERIYLDESFNCDCLVETLAGCSSNALISVPAYRPMYKKVCKAMQTYGAIVMDVTSHGGWSIVFENLEGKSYSWTGTGVNAPGEWYRIDKTKYKISLPIYPGTNPPDTTPPSAPAGLSVQ